MVLLEAARERGIVLTEDEKTEYLARLAVGRPRRTRPAARPPIPPRGPSTGSWSRNTPSSSCKDVRVDAGEIRDLLRAEQEGLPPPGPGPGQPDPRRRPRRRRSTSCGGSSGPASRSSARSPPRSPWAPSPPEAGVMGVFEQGDLPADMEKVIFSLDEGRTSQVVESSYGYPHLPAGPEAPPGPADRGGGRPADPGAPPGPEDEGRPGLPPGRAQGDPGLAGPDREPILQLSEVGRMKKIIACLAMAGVLAPLAVRRRRPGGRRGDRGRRQRRRHHPDRVPGRSSSMAAAQLRAQQMDPAEYQKQYDNLKKQLLDAHDHGSAAPAEGQGARPERPGAAQGDGREDQAGEQLRLRRRTCAGPSSSRACPTRPGSSSTRRA
ncbi:MAG: peptidylprolyl isomerase [Desulfobacterales bacterium]|nr:peptidylprolyl isomerase [Desulfobacterales bacterium]